jgi:diadenosine tetraphosphate (Ap4A) HIT family hydrolase
MSCLFCDIISGKQKGWLVYEDEQHVGFLTPFPNTPGFTVLVTREHQNSDVLALDEERYLEFVKAARKLAHRINQKLGVQRTGLIIEGMGIDHAHIKLIPMHGIPDGDWKPMLSNKKEYSEIYQGYLSTHDGPKMNDTKLDEIQGILTS